jgi:hypothetical protein
MTDTDFEARLIRYLQARAEDAVEPIDASMIADTAIGATRRRDPRLQMLLAAAVVTLAVVGTAGAIVVGGLLNQRPNPSPPVDIASPDASAEVTLGGGLILAYQPHESPGDCPFDSLAPFDVITVDPATGAQAVLGTTAEGCSARWLNLQWAPDREHILMTDELGHEPMALDTATDDGRDLIFICCDLPTDVWLGGANQSQGWVLSPAGDRVAAIHTSQFQVPGEAGPTGIADGIVVANIDGSGRVFLPLPEGADIRGGASWAPDQSALVVAACLPCNRAQPGQPATAENHEHLYVVPVDGSPVREMLDDTSGYSWTPAWAPDGLTFAIGRNECLSELVPLQCSGEVTSSLVLVDAASGSRRVAISGDQLGEGLSVGPPLWSSDSARIAFTAYSSVGDPLRVFVVDADGTNLVDLGEGGLVDWSPDGEWLLVGRSAAASYIDLWVIRPDGSDARSLGTFLESLATPAAW